MTQPPRTTESISRDNAAIRDIMLQIRELTVPDRATLALGLIGHLATMMNRNQMAKLMDELREEAERVQDVPPARQREDDRARDVNRDGGTEARAAGGGSNRGERDNEPGEARAAAGRNGVGQAGRGEFRGKPI